MISTAPMEINVVYSAGARRRRGRPPRRVGPARPSRLLILGLLNLLAASSLYYAAWWRVDKVLYIKILMHSPIPNVDLNAAAAMFQPRGARPVAKPSPPPPKVEPQPAWLKMLNDYAIAITAYTWLTLATMAAGALAMSSGAAFGRVAASRWKRRRALLALAGVAGLGLAGYLTWRQDQQSYLPDHLRMGMGGLVLVAGLIGLAVGRGVRQWTYFAAIAVIVSAIGSAAGLYVANVYGAIDPDELPLTFLPFVGVVFACHFLWGWILLPVASRLGR